MSIIENECNAIDTWCWKYIWFIGTWSSPAPSPKKLTVLLLLLFIKNLLTRSICYLHFWMTFKKRDIFKIISQISPLFAPTKSLETKEILWSTKEISNLEKIFCFIFLFPVSSSSGRPAANNQYNAVSQVGIFLI